jgi:hypothetical protein
MQTVTTVAEMPVQAEPKLRKRIGSTIYLVNIRFSLTSGETPEEIILRMIESEVEKSA